MNTFENQTWDANVIVPKRIYLGSVDATTSFYQLKSHGIDYVLDIVGLAPRFQNIKYLSFPSVLDLPSQDISLYFVISIAFIYYALRSDSNILINCYAGISRSSSILAAYLIYVYNLSVVEAVSYLQQQRSIVRPNDGFLQQLYSFQAYIADPINRRELDLTVGRQVALYQELRIKGETINCPIDVNNIKI